MHGSKIAIWFFIGVMLLVYGVLSLAYGLYELATGYNPGVQLYELHTPVWWGLILTVLGLLYVIKFRPGKEAK